MLRIAIPTINQVDNYINALKAAGSSAGEAVEPVLIHPGESFDTALLDGLVLPGGGDIAPSRYGEEDKGCFFVSPELDALQFGVLDSFIRLKKPVLGICRGHQLINVYFGGSLIQDIPEKEAHGRSDGVDNIHPVRALPSSFLTGLYGEAFLSNSAHHQAADKIGSGLKATAFSEDGIIEALEHSSLPVKAVQFHPERMMLGLGDKRTADGEAIIRYFLEKIVLPAVR